jgi:co-chaperonin GroES (HSP10)|tara:strand:- start:2504 stop:2782 length:279 start_codon:yes stop_codon:yes gene_type:complete
MAMKMKNDYLLIEDIVEQKTNSGLWIPPDPKNRKAKVLEIADGEEDIEVGDVVLKGIGKGTSVRIDGKWLEAIHKNNLLAVLKNRMGDDKNN